MKIQVLAVERVHPVRRNGVIDTSIITADGVLPRLGFFQCVLQYFCHKENALQIAAALTG